MAELSGLEVLALTEEIDGALRGSYVNNIFRIGDAQIVSFREPGGKQIRLVASRKVGAWLSEKIAEREETTEFTTRLRQLLVRAKFERATQIDLDRIFVFEMSAEEPVRLVLELMPPGNLIVTDGAGRILALRDEVRTPRRRVVRGEVYEPPKQNRLSPDRVGGDDVTAMANAERTAGQALGKHVALPRKYVKEVLGRLSISENSPSSTIFGRETEVAQALKGLVDEARTSPSPSLVEIDGKAELLVVSPTAFKVQEKGHSISAICDEIFLDRILHVEPGSSEEDRQRAELEARISKLRLEEETYLTKAARARELAAVAARASSVTYALKAAAELGIKPKTDPASPEAVASMVYDLAKELEAKAAEVGRAAKRIRAKAPKPSVEATKRKHLTVRNREWYEKFRWFQTSGDKLAIGGRDAATNSILVRRHLEERDTVYHASLFGSPFFILKGGAGQTKDEEREVAQATVTFSSAWKNGLGSADAYWVIREQVSTSAPSGEFLPRGGFLITGKKNLIQHNLVEIAVGLDSRARVISGPENAIKKKALAYVVLRPQKEKGSETAKRVLNDLEALVGESIHAKLSVDDVLRMLPTGGGKVLRKHRIVSRNP